MQRPRVFISNYPFARESKRPLEILKKEGYEIILNPHPRKLKPFETAELGQNCDAVIAGTEDLTLLVNSSPHLKMISRIGIGLDNVPLTLCRKRGIQVTYTPDAVTPAVTELTIGLMIALSRHVVMADHEIRENQWTRFYGKRIEKSVIGIVGLGRVGYQVAGLLTGFRPEKVLVNDIINVGEKIANLKAGGLNVEFAEKDFLLENSDIVTLHVPLTSKTRMMVNSHSISLMKKPAFLINTSRGEIVNEDDLYNALLEKRLTGAAIDVFQEEPYSGNLRLLQNIILTQHMGSCSFDCREQMETEAAQEVVRFLSGEPLKTPVPDSEYLEN